MKLLVPLNFDLEYVDSRGGQDEGYCKISSVLGRFFSALPKAAVLGEVTLQSAGMEADISKPSRTASRGRVFPAPG
jgi:hypothetical protein